MANRAAHEIMTPAQMDEMNEQLMLDNRLYSKGADGTEQVRSILTEITGDLMDKPKKIKLYDTALVEQVTKEYIASCVRSGILPSRQGHARAMGVSRRSVTSYMTENPDHPSTQYLEIVYDAFSEALSMASLTGRVHPIVSIFIQKAIYGWRDNDPVEQPENDPLGTAKTNDELYMRYCGGNDGD